MSQQSKNIFLPWDLETTQFKSTNFNEPKNGVSFLTKPTGKMINYFLNQFDAKHWSVDELDFRKDSAIVHQNRHTPLFDQLKHILAFFTIVEGPIAENLTTFYDLFCPDITSLFARQGIQEREHGITYTKLITCAYSLEVDQLHDEIAKLPDISKKIDWMDRFLGPNSHLLERFAYSAMAEGILFQSSFACISYLKTTGNYHFDSIYNANEYILKDEMLHHEMFQWLFGELKASATCSTTAFDERIKIAFEECIKIEKEFVDAIFEYSPDFAGISKATIMDYVDYVAELVWHGLYPSKEYNQRPNPLPFMYIVPTTYNMFERKGINYIGSNFGNIDFDD